MKLSTFLLVMSSAFVLLVASCGAMGATLAQSTASGTSSYTGDGSARPPGPAPGGTRPVTARCAASARSQGLPASLAPEGQNARTHLTNRAQNLKDQIEERFPDAFDSIGGYRAGPDAYSDDHGCGRALDVMVSKLGVRSDGDQTANGFAIAAWAERNADVLGLHYVIFQQCIWNVQRSGEGGCTTVAAPADAKGWRPLSDRGSVTQNHYDHVHLSVW